MKNLLKLTMLVVFAFVLGANSYGQTKCGVCAGYGKLVCGACQGYGKVAQTVFNPYTGLYQNVPATCSNCNGYGALICSNCGGNGYIISNNNTTFRGDWIKVKKSVSKCKGHGGSLCSCKLYVGYKRAGSEYYQGSCENYVNGHRCGHGPGAHGLPEW